MLQRHKSDMVLVVLSIEQFPVIIIQRFNPPSTNPSTLGVHQHHQPRLHCLNKNVQYLISQNILHLSGQNISYLVDQNVQYLISVNFIRNEYSIYDSSRYSPFQEAALLRSEAPKLGPSCSNASVWKPSWTKC